MVPNWTDPQSLGRYSYCRNNPLRYVDPSGHDEVPTAAQALTQVERDMLEDMAPNILDMLQTATEGDVLVALVLPRSDSPLQQERFYGEVHIVESDQGEKIAYSDRRRRGAGIFHF